MGRLLCRLFCRLCFRLSNRFLCRLLGGRWVVVAEREWEKMVVKTAVGCVSVCHTSAWRLCDVEASGCCRWPGVC